MHGWGCPPPPGTAWSLYQKVHCSREGILYFSSTFYFTEAYRRGDADLPEFFFFGSRTNWFCFLRCFLCSFFLTVIFLFTLSILKKELPNFICSKNGFNHAPFSFPGKHAQQERTNYGHVFRRHRENEAPCQAYHQDRVAVFGMPFFYTYKA